MPVSLKRAVKEAQKRAVKVYKQARRKSTKQSKVVANTARKGIKALMKSVKVFQKKVKDRDKVYRKRVREIKKLSRLRLRIGVLAAGDAEHKGSPGLTVREVGTFHELGLGVPRRSFIRDWYDPNVARIRARAGRVSELVVSGQRTTKVAASLLGLWAQGEIQERITQGIAPPLAVSTILRRKHAPTREGKTIALIDTGQLRSSITFEVKT